MDQLELTSNPEAPMQETGPGWFGLMMKPSVTGDERPQALPWGLYLERGSVMQVDDEVIVTQS